MLFSVTSRARTRDTGHWAQTEIQEVAFKHKKKTLLLWGWLTTGTGCPERSWGLHSWRYSKLKPHIVNSNLFHLTLLWTRGWTRQPLGVPSNLGCSVSLSLTFILFFSSLSLRLCRSQVDHDCLILQRLPRTSWTSGFLSSSLKGGHWLSEVLNKEIACWGKVLTNLLGCEQAFESLKSWELTTVKQMNFWEKMDLSI